MYKIAIFDDNQRLRQMLRDILKDTFIVKDYPAPLFKQVVAELDADVLLVDVWYQDWASGKTFVKSLSKDQAMPPVLLMSSDPDLPEYASEVDAADWIAKPFDVDTLLIKLERLLAQQGDT